MHAAGCEGRQRARAGLRRLPHRARHRRDRERGWKLGIIRECGTCHEQSLRTYRDTFHGKITELGFTRVAKCADCHGAHDILPASNPASTISPSAGCQTCQQVPPERDGQLRALRSARGPARPRRNPALDLRRPFMKLLLGGVFLFFGMHTLLWFPRSWQARRERDRRPCRAGTPPALSSTQEGRRSVSHQGTAAGRHFRRFDAFNRGLHLAMMTSFLGLAATRLPLLFSSAPWASSLSRLFGGFQVGGHLPPRVRRRDDHHVRAARRPARAPDRDSAASRTSSGADSSMVPQPRDLRTSSGT